jgi:uncharacterized protein involved in exopolysaccharide biosynthesis
MEEDTVELIDYLMVIWKRKRLIIVGTLACMVTAGVISLTLPKVYRASVIFLLEDSKILQEKDVRYYNPRLFETYGKTYMGIIKNRTTMNQAIKKFQLNKEPYKLTLEGLDGLVSVNTIEKSKLLRLDVKFPDRELARDIVNFLADKAVEFNDTLNATGATKNRDFIKGQMEIAKEALDEAESKLLKFREKVQLAVLRKKADILLSRKAKIEGAISYCKVEIAKNKGLLKKFEEEFAKRDKTVKLYRRLAEDPLYQQSLAHLSESDVKRIFNLSMEVEVPDPTYAHLEKRLVDIIPTLGGLYAKRDFLQAELKENTPELEAILVELAKQEAELKRLQRVGNLAEATYTTFVRRFEQITISVASRSQDLKILDPAIRRGEFFGPNKKRNVFMAGVFGSMMSLFLAFFMEYLEKARERGKAF